MGGTPVPKYGDKIKIPVPHVFKNVERRDKVMIGMDFYEWFLEKPYEAITALIVMIVIVVTGFIIMAWSKHKEKIQNLQSEIKRLQWELQRESELKSQQKIRYIGKGLG